MGTLRQMGAQRRKRHLGFATTQELSVMTDIHLLSGQIRRAVLISSLANLVVVVTIHWIRWLWVKSLATTGQPINRTRPLLFRSWRSHLSRSPLRQAQAAVVAISSSQESPLLMSCQTAWISQFHPR